MTVVEFYNTLLRHYFRTASSAEAANIDAGKAGPGWFRTGDNFYAYAAGTNGSGVNVCRFYTFLANSHFYTGNGTECNGLKAPASGWVYEGIAFRTPVPAGASCAVWEFPVYRLFNNRFRTYNDSNHRFTTMFSSTTRA